MTFKLTSTSKNGSGSSMFQVMQFVIIAGNQKWKNICTNYRNLTLALLLIAFVYKDKSYLKTFHFGSPITLTPPTAKRQQSKTYVGKEIDNNNMIEYSIKLKT